MFADKKKKKKDINIFVFSIFAIICFKSFSINAIKLPQDEGKCLNFKVPIFLYFLSVGKVSMYEKVSGFLLLQNMIFFS